MAIRRGGTALTGVLAALIGGLIAPVLVLVLPLADLGAAAISVTRALKARERRADAPPAQVAPTAP